MAHEIVEKYISDTLKPQLTDFGVPSALIENVITSIREQMLSCLYHWNDITFRRTILVIGEEEGSFYSPKADPDIRSFVVVTVRNSPLESIHADSYNADGQGRRLTADDIRAVTSAAIKYFSNIDIPNITKGMNLSSGDKYGELAGKYPISWAAFTALANSKKQTIEYEPIPLTKKPDLNNLTRQHAVNGMFFDEKRNQMMQVTADGYSMTIDLGLAHILDTIIKEKMPFFCDSFKGISRNVEKLFSVIEYIFGNGLFLISSNYIIANGYIERRIKPIKPGHDHEEMIRNWKNNTGLTENHKKWLKAAADI
jgi:hypothetical protein